MEPYFVSQINHTGGIFAQKFTNVNSMSIFNLFNIIGTVFSECSAPSCASFKISMGNLVIKYTVIDSCFSTGSTTTTSTSRIVGAGAFYFDGNSYTSYCLLINKCYSPHVSCASITTPITQTIYCNDTTLSLCKCHSFTMVFDLGRSYMKDVNTSHNYVDWHCASLHFGNCPAFFTAAFLTVNNNTATLVYGGCTVSSSASQYMETKYSNFISNKCTDGVFGIWNNNVIGIGCSFVSNIGNIVFNFGSGSVSFVSCSFSTSTITGSISDCSFLNFNTISISEYQCSLFYQSQAMIQYQLSFRFYLTLIISMFLA